MLEINNLHEVIVKVNAGSGIVLKFESNNKCYVLTAYHNIEDSIENDENFELFNDKNEPYNIIEKPYFDKDKDIAILEIDYIENISIVHYSENILPENEIMFMGYPDRGESKRKSLNGKIIEWNDTKTAINVVENIQGSFVKKEKTDEVIVGFSGSPVFKKNGQELSLIGILKSLPNDEFYYKEIDCIPITSIVKFIQDNKLGELKLLEIIKTQDNVISATEWNQTIRKDEYPNKTDLLSNQINSMLTQVLEGQPKSTLQLKNDTNISPPPLPQKISKRESLVKQYSKKLENFTHLHIQGEIGMGKTQLCNLLIENSNREVYWFRIREFSTQIKSLIIELKNIISNKSIKRFFTKKLKIKEHAIIILDDLPNLNNAYIDDDIIQLIEICKSYDVKIISSSNYPLPRKISQHTDLIESVRIQGFDDTETEDLLKAYDAPNELYKFAPIINIFSDNHPWLIVPIVTFLKSKNWKIDFDSFFKNRFLDDEISNFQLILKESIADKQTRELAYRLNIIGRTIVEDDVKLVSSIEPSIEHAFEKFNSLLNIFIYKESDSEYLISPILYRLGSKNLDLNVAKSANSHHKCNTSCYLT